MCADSRYLYEVYVSILQVEITKLASDSSSSDSDDSSDSEVAVDAARTGRQMHPDGTVSSATAAEAKLAAQLAKDPWGRFGGRQGKMARIRAQEEAQLALLAAKAMPPAAAAGLKRKAAVTVTAAVVDSSKSKSKRRKTDGGSAGQPDGKRDRLTVVVADPVADQLAAECSVFSPTPATGWWGAKRFISSGAMGAVSIIPATFYHELSAFSDSPRCPPLIENTAVDLLAASAHVSLCPHAYRGCMGRQIVVLSRIHCFWMYYARWLEIHISRHSQSHAARRRPLLQGGNGDKPAGSRERTKFTEDTQENLYMALHNAKTSGKTGLGKGKGSGESLMSTFLWSHFVLFTTVVLLEVDRWCQMSCLHLQERKVCSD